ncbi:unnamed protein product [Toxocara canis]|uniref:Uncharacterized protein n=1 Tax=Toxocara canis TaxID=6265 RepID=A0A183TWX1_TOXCA|nr:unnamed protein product [Toxocara canis]
MRIALATQEQQKYEEAESRCCYTASSHYLLALILPRARALTHPLNVFCTHIPDVMQSHPTASLNSEVTADV